MSIFNQIRRPKVKKSMFNLSHQTKLTTKFGELTPFLCQEVLPGDKWKMNANVFTKFMPLLTPVMQGMKMTVHYFFVPNRLLWDNWEEFITGGEKGMDEPIMPYIEERAGEGNLKTGNLADMLGYPTISTNGKSYTIKCNALPFKAYAKIWNDYYRDENLEEEIPLHTEKDGKHIFGKGDLNPNILRRCWTKDYFTSALPDAQRGPDVSIPMDGNVIYNNPLKKRQHWVTPGGDSVGQGDARFANTIVGMKATEMLSGNIPSNLDPHGTLKVDKAETTINDLRIAERLQQFLENSARGGARYIEQIFSHFGVKSSDSRLQRSEYLGGSTSPIVVDEVIQTSFGPEESPQGNQSGQAWSVNNTNGFKRYFEEHGWLIGIVSVTPTAEYFQGCSRSLCERWKRTDFAWPEFANLGEQAILNKEIYANCSEEEQEGTFGYTPRYAEYKYIPNTIHGDFKNTLMNWHLARKFEELPKLNADFVSIDDKQFNRIFAVTDTKADPILIAINNNIKAVRRLPKWGTPRL